MGATFVHPSIRRTKEIAANRIVMLLCVAAFIVAAGGCGPNPPTDPTATPIRPATPLPPSAHYPILLVSGFGGNPLGKTIDPPCPPLVDHKLTDLGRAYTPTVPPTADGTFGDLAATLSKDYGYFVNYTPIISTPCYSARIRDNIPMLKAQIEKTLNDAANAQPTFRKPDKVIIIAHSTGGVVARAYLEDKQANGGTLPTNVSDLFTFGAPHEGITISTNWFAILFFLRDKFPGETWTDYLVRQEVFKDFDADGPDGLRSYNKNLPPNPNVNYHYYAGNIHGLKHWGYADILNLLYLNDANDGLISLDSAAYLDSHIPAIAFRDSHSGDFGEPSYFANDSPIATPLLTALAETALRPTPIPTSVGSVAPAYIGSATPADSFTPIPVCTPASLINAMLNLKTRDNQDIGSALDIGSRLAPAIGQYSHDCGPTRITPEGLVAEAASHGVVIKYTASDLSEIRPFVVTPNNLHAGFTSATSPPVLDIPDSYALQIGSKSYVFYPDIDVQQGITTIAPVTNASLRTITGNTVDNAKEETLPFKNANLQPGETGIVKPGALRVLDIQEVRPGIHREVEAKDVKEKPIREIGNPFP